MPSLGNPEARRDRRQVLPRQLDLQARTALEQITLETFTVDPSRIDPFGRSTLSWAVSIPEGSEMPVNLEIDGTPVGASGELLVAPESTRSYQLRVSAWNYSQVLGTVTVDVDLARCIALSEDPIFQLTAVIKYRVDTDKSNVVFRTTSEPILSIQGNQMIVRLHLSSTDIGGPDIDIDASFELGVAPIPPYGPAQNIIVSEHNFHRLVYLNPSTNVDVSFPWYVWLVPGAMLILPIVRSGIESQGHAKATEIIKGIVDCLNDWFKQSFVQPPGMDKHDAGFYVNPQGGRFWVTFCPVVKPEIEGQG